MLRNIFVVAYRNLVRQFSYSVINISGLAIGIACSLVIFLYVYKEWSYDRHYANADRIYKIGVTFFNMGGFGVGPEALGDFLPKEFDGVEAFTRVKRVRELLITRDDQTFNELAYYTDSSFFRIFSFEFARGDRNKVLQQPDNMVLSERMAKKFFPNEDAVGKTLAIGKEKKLYTVTGIVKNDERSTQFTSGIWLSIESQLTHSPVWSSASTFNYVLLKEKNTRQDLDDALERIMKNQVYPQAPGVPKGISYEDYKAHPNAVKFFVHALKDVHLKSNLNFEISPVGNEANMYTFAAISVFILLLASVNFINLTTARAARRAKEVGIRKVVGSSRRKLITQFIMESVMVSMTAMVLSLLLAEFFIRGFEWISGSPLQITLWDNAATILILIAFAFVVGLVSGVYPAFYLTSFKPVSVLKGNLSLSGRGGLRNFLVVFQFSISICLMICSTIIMRQMEFMKTKDLGFDQENMVVIDNMQLLKEQAEAFKNEMSKISGVEKASLYAGEPGSKSIMSISTFSTPHTETAIPLHSYAGDADFVSTMGFHLIAGRDFDRNLASDSSGVILNEAAVKTLGLEEPIIGAEINPEEGQVVIGVVSDFHWESLRNEIGPVAITPAKKFYQAGFRLKSRDAKTFLTEAEKKWKQLAPDEPFKYHFLDSNFGDLLEKERTFGKAIGFFTALAMLISCLGLYGLSAYTAERRTKEIGIRKVLGAGVSDIVGMLNRQFAILVTIAIVIAVPVSIYFMTGWMEGFAYRAGLQLWIFLGSIALALLVALATVSFHSFRAAWVNPADTLKYE